MKLVRSPFSLVSLFALCAAPVFLHAADTPAIKPLTITTGAPAKAAKPVVPSVPTVIISTKMEMWSTDTETRSVFTENVVVTGNNLKITCDKLDITAIRFDDPKAKDDTIGALEKFKTLVATGNVHIIQGDREVTCGRAEIFPGEDSIVLTEKPVVIDLSGPFTATGDKITIKRGERRIFGDNIRFQGPPIKDLGFEKDKPVQAPAPLPRLPKL